MNFSEEQILALAPDDSSKKSGRELANSSKWVKREMVIVRLGVNATNPGIFSRMSTLLRQHAEQLFAHELDELKKADTEKRPPNWLLSPQAVVTYILGGKLKNGFEISPKYIGNRRLIEIAVATRKKSDLPENPDAVSAERTLVEMRETIYRE